MGVNLKSLVLKKEIKLSQLKGKKIAIDTYLVLYQFLKTMPIFTDRKGRITTHLLGLFFRTTHLMAEGLKLCFILDGPLREIKRYRKIISGQFSFRETTTLTSEIIKESIELLTLLGLPVIQAPAEGEAQAAFMTTERCPLAKRVWAVGSQDYDCLIFGAKRMVFNLTFSRYRKLPSDHKPIRPYLIELKEILKEHKISFNQLILLSILIGTDFNPEGAKVDGEGIGPKRALELIKKYPKLSILFSKRRKKEKIEWDFEVSPDILFSYIKTMPVTLDYKLKWVPPDKRKLIKFLCEERDFSKERVKAALNRIKE